MDMDACAKNWRNLVWLFEEDIPLSAGDVVTVESEVTLLGDPVYHLRLSVTTLAVVRKSFVKIFKAKDLYPDFEV
jgi:hypothetical protein